MDKCLKKFKATNYVHCIIKEELIISDDEKDESVRVKVEPIDENFVDTDFEEKKFNGQTKRKRGFLENKIYKARNDKQSTLDSFLKSENAESNERSKNSITTDEKPKGTGRADNTTSDNIDKLYKKITKSYCRECNVKTAVIRGKARCDECNTQLTYCCETCNTTYRDFTNLGYHLQKKHTDNSELHICTICKKSFAFRQYMLDHRRLRHQKSVSGKSRCVKCGKMFDTKLIVEHEKSCEAQAPIKCDKCSYTTNYQANLRKHVYNKHTDFNKQCENCKKFFTNRKSMRRHLRVYCNKTKRIECHHCGHKVYRRDQMMNHLDQAHFGGLLTGNPVNDSEMPRNCKYCDEVLKPYEKMKYHLRQCESAPLEFRRQSSPDIGNDRRARTCNYCGVELRRYEHIRYHLDRCEFAPPECRLENENADQPDLDTACKNLSKAYCENCKTKRPPVKGQRCCQKCETTLKFICERCLKSFNRASNLFHHLQVKHVKKTTFFRCDKCHSSYSHLKYLKLHKETHHSSKPITKIYTCSKCGQKYYNDGSFRKHRVSCVEEPKFHCDKCPYKTHFKSSLVDHFRAKKSTCF